MRLPVAPALLVAAPALIALLAPSCGGTGEATPGGTTAPTTTASTTGGDAASCRACIAPTDCAGGELCAQFGGDIYCAIGCAGGAACPTGTRCAAVSGFDGAPVEVCAPVAGACAVGNGAGGAGGANGTQTPPPAGQVCGSLRGPDAASCCAGCADAGGSSSCQKNGCTGGAWCDDDACDGRPARKRKLPRNASWTCLRRRGAVAMWAFGAAVGELSPRLLAAHRDRFPRRAHPFAWRSGHRGRRPAAHADLGSPRHVPQCQPWIPDLLT